MLYIWRYRLIFAIINLLTSFSLLFLAILDILPSYSWYLWFDWYFLCFIVYIFHFSILLPYLSILFSIFDEVKFSSQKIWGWPSRTKIKVEHRIEVRAWVWPHIAQNKLFNYICFCLRILTHWCPLVGKVLACNGILEQGLGVGVGRFWPLSRSVFFAAGLIANSNTNMYKVPWTKSSITAMILHNWQHSAVLCLWGKK